MTRWRIYYGDGSTFSDADGMPQDAPARNVQVIAQADDRVGRQLQAGHDYYWYDEEAGGWVGGDLFGLWDFLARGSRVKFGRTIANKGFRAIWRKARDDPAFPPKSAWLPDERRVE